jgi:phytoene dehydrogenase-like protein
MDCYDAIVVGSGPNGVAAAAYLSRAGRSVLVVEAASTPGGGARTAELTLPGFRHDVCSAIHPLAVMSPFLSELPLADHGLEWIHPDVPAAHPLDGGRVAVLRRSVGDTAAGLGDDGPAWRRLFEPFVEEWGTLAHQLLGPVRFPRHPLPVARFGLLALRSTRRLVDGRFHGEAAKALFAGMSGHAFLPIDHRTSAAFGLLMIGAGHAGGWPMPRSGAQALSDALVSYCTSNGVTFWTGRPVSSLRDLPPAPVVLLDTSPSEALRILTYKVPALRRVQLGSFRPGPAVFKVDYALSEPVPWAAPEAHRAGTVHVGGSIDEIQAGEKEVGAGRHPERPFLLAVQHTRFDPTRAPAGQHTLWAYCHVPNGSTVDMTKAMEAQIERFAPGFGDVIVARQTTNPAELERYNRNYIGGDIAGGANDGLQLFARPRLGLNPYFVDDRDGRRIYLCSASTPPGGGVHGMCGFHAARIALRHVNRTGITSPPSSPS